MEKDKQPERAEPLDAVAARRAATAVAGAKARGQVKAAEEPPPAPPVVDEDKPAEAPAPAEPEKPAAKFKAGDKVRSKDSARMPGKVKGEAMPSCPDYEIETADGGMYVESESQMEPDDGAPMEEEPMDENTVVPGALGQQLAQAVGLSGGATLGQIAAAGKVQGEQVVSLKADLDAERNEARNAACLAGGMRPGLVAVVAPTVVRGAGQTWDQAVSAHRETMPDAYVPAAEPKAETPEAKAPPVAAAPAAPLRKGLPAGMNAGENKTPPNPASAGPKSFPVGKSSQPVLG